MDRVDQAEGLVRRGGRVHLAGIGGVGMAGLAWLLKARGLQVDGCDLVPNRLTGWLQRNGIAVATGQDAAHIDGTVDWLIRSTAVPDRHPEVRRANEVGIPVSRRGDVLPALMRDRTCIAVGGTHGKTTTTAMIAQVLGCGYCIGGEIAGMDGVARDDSLMVVEADESDGTIAGYSPDYAVITNIEYDHMEHHASESAFVGCFERFIAKTRRKVFYRGDDPIASRLCGGLPDGEPFAIPDPPFQLPVPGRHNQWNAAAALAACRPWMEEGDVRRALASFRPVRRRFETVFEGGGVRIVSDYAHHPTEIAALIQTALELEPGRLLGIFQPHRYTRTRALAAEFPASFEGLDRLWLLPVYAASEAPLPGGTTADLVRRFDVGWQDRLEACPSMEAAWAGIRQELRAGDLLLVIGAGDIEKVAEWARALEPTCGAPRS